MEFVRLIVRYAWLIHKNAYYTIFEFLQVNGYLALSFMAYLMTLSHVWNRAKARVTRPSRRLGY